MPAMPDKLNTSLLSHISICHFDLADSKQSVVGCKVPLASLRLGNAFDELSLSNSMVI